ncbi:MAG: hydrogenase maturation protease [Actinomycetota bacterium]|nr:hydrogenase maturation protease [Actinomycetota bacterium]
MTVLVACFGNVLRGDDGFGVAVARRLRADAARSDVHVLEVGIGGIHLVQELMRGVDVLLVVDAVDLGRAAGTVVVQVPDVPDVTMLPAQQQRDELADMHYATPERALLLARALGVLPATTLLVGVQTTDAGRVGEGLSPAAEAAVQPAVDEIRRLVAAHSPAGPRP